jgi:hypothetical protein
MANNSIRVSADTSEFKKSILDLSRSLKSLSSSKLSLISADDKKFFKTEFKKELGLMKDRLIANRNEIKKMVDEQKKLTRGTAEELEQRKKILDAYKTQTKLSKEYGDLNKATTGNAGGFGGMLKGGLAGLAAATIGYGLTRSVQAAGQYNSGVGNRVRLKGLGVNTENFGTAGQQAGAGLSEQEVIDRVVKATAVLGRHGSNVENEIQKAMFERSFGLQGGTMTNVSGALRANFGGKGANDAQMKLQATILASGIEDALGPYLDTMTNLLNSINENGMTDTSQITDMMARIVAEGSRTPEQVSKLFQGLNEGIKNSSGEQNAFMQTAFARAGIGGGTLGGTDFALRSGGLFGLNSKDLLNKGYNPQLVENYGKQGITDNFSGRSSAFLNQIKRSAGVGMNQNLSGITNTNTAESVGRLTGSAFGIKDPQQAFEAALMLEKVKKGTMTEKDFNKKLQDMQKDPQLQRLDKINDSLAGQTDVLNKMLENQMEALGKTTIKTKNVLTNADIAGVQATNTNMQALDKAGMNKAGMGITNGANYLFGGGLGASTYDAYSSAKGFISNLFSGKNSMNNSSGGPKVTVNIQNRMPDGKVNNKTHK